MTIGNTLDLLVDELESKGYSHQTTLNRHIEEAAQELWHEARWDFRRADVTGPAPLDIGEKGALVKHVRLDGSNATLKPTTEAAALDALAGGSGTPSRYYVRDDETIYTDPDSTMVLRAVVYSAAPWTTGGLQAASGSDVLKIPVAYLDVVVMLGEIRAMREDDRAEEAANARAPGGELSMRLGQMKEAMLTEQADEPRVVRPQSYY
jgi:hypothetical protein